MRKLQVMEFALWQVQAIQVKPGVGQDQAFAKVDKWDGTTFEALWRAMQNQNTGPLGWLSGSEKPSGSAIIYRTTSFENSS